MNVSDDPFSPVEAGTSAPLSFTPDRRTFLKGIASGLIILVLPRATWAQTAAVRPEAPVALEAWLRLDAEGTITAFTGKTEIGQNIRTSLAQAVAEELPAPLDSIRLVMADTDAVPWDFGTVGSRTTSQMSPQLRRAAACAREELLDRTAALWRVPRGELTARDGRIHHPASARSIGYGELVKGQPLTRAIPDDIPLRPASEWKIMGTSVPKIGGEAFVTGAHHYTSDMTVPGVRHGRMLRAPAFGATLQRLESNGVERLPGVTLVHDGNFVGVVASSVSAAIAALARLRPEWTLTPQVSEGLLFAHLRPGYDPQPRLERDANELRAFGTYTVDFIAHVPLEPRAALAQWSGERVTVWTGTQRPFTVRAEVARGLGIDESRVRIVVPDTGSAYGGKHSGEAALEAARLARTAQAPVKLVWTREEEFTWAYARPAGVMEITSRVDRSGKLLAWQHENWNSGGSGLPPVYAIPSPTTRFHPANSPLRHGSYRALAATANHFARETHVDELAVDLGIDPVEFRLRNLTDERVRAVLHAAVEKFDWSNRPVGQRGRGAGVAVGLEKNSVVATCAEVAVNETSGEITVVRVVQAYECGAIINPAHLQGQCEGCIIQGLGGALFERLGFREGRITNPRLASYRVPRFADIPPIEIVLLDRKDIPSIGGSETPIVGIAPALGNAIHAATGIRLRALPLAPALAQAWRGRPPATR